MYRTALLSLLLIGACTGPTEVVGPGDPEKLHGSSKPVTSQFGPAQTRQLHQQITSPEFRRALSAYTCGDPVPDFAVTLAFWPERTWNSRLIFVYTDPELGVDRRDTCLMIGFSYEVARALRRLDRGEPMTYKTTDGKTIKASPPVLNRPICDCARRGDNTAWVDLAPEE